MGERLRQAPGSPAGRARVIDLKLRLALRVAALAAVCFVAVAAYALIDSDRTTRARARPHRRDRRQGYLAAAGADALVLAVLRVRT